MWRLYDDDGVSLDFERPGGSFQGALLFDGETGRLNAGDDERANPFGTWGEITWRVMIPKRDR